MKWYFIAFVGAIPIAWQTPKAFNVSNCLSDECFVGLLGACASAIYWINQIKCEIDYFRMEWLVRRDIVIFDYVFRSSGPECGFVFVPVRQRWHWRRMSDWKSVIFLLLWFFAPQIRFMPIGCAYRFLVCFHIVASNWYTHCLHQPPLISGARRRIESRNTHTFALECRCQKHKLSYQMRNDFCFDCCCWLGPNKAFIHHFTANGIRYLLHSFIICVFRLRSIGIYSIPFGCQFSHLGATDAERDI